MTIALMGVGQLGSVFACGLLRQGRQVLPVLRDTPEDVANARMSRAAYVLLTVGEADLDAALARVPPDARSRVALVQNELLPVDWLSRGVQDPTVAVVWFEKKAGKPIHPIRSTPIAGPWAEQLVACLACQGIPAHVIEPAALARELVLKNLYILASNLGGLASGAATVGELAETHAPQLRQISDDILRLERARLGQDGTLPSDQELFAGLLAAIADDPTHGARGRSAPARLRRALERADALGVATPTLRAIVAV